MFYLWNMPRFEGGFRLIWSCPWDPLVLQTRGVKLMGKLRRVKNPYWIHEIWSKEATQNKDYLTEYINNNKSNKLILTRLRIVSDRNGLMRAKTISKRYDSLMIWISRNRNGNVFWMILATDLTWSRDTFIMCEKQNPARSTTITKPATWDFASRAIISSKR